MRLRYGTRMARTVRRPVVRAKTRAEVDNRRTKTGVCLDPSTYQPLLAGGLDTYCWCASHRQPIRPEIVRAGRTWSCGPTCREAA